MAPDPAPNPDPALHPGPAARPAPTPEDLVAPEHGALRAALEAARDLADPSTLQAVRRAHPHADPALVAALATQVDLRRRAADRLGPWAADMVLEAEALQQATRTDVARYRADRMAELWGAGTRVADVGCGLGVDARALAEAGFEVVAIEQDPWRAAAARVNLAGRQAQVIDGDATQLSEMIAECGAAYIDPARREQGAPRDIAGGRARPLARSDDWSPPWSWVVALSDRLPVIAKVAPGFDPRMAPASADLEWIDHGGETVELSVWMRPGGAGAGASTGRRSATVLGPGSASIDDLAPSDVARTELARNYLIEPAPAVRRAGLVDQVGEFVGAERLAGRTWLTADAPDASRPDRGGLAAPPSALTRAWRVIEEVPFGAKELRAWLRSFGSVTWKTADTGASAADWERRVGHRPVRGAPSVTIVITASGRAYAVERAG